MIIPFLRTRDTDFVPRLAQVLQRDTVLSESVRQRVRDILLGVRQDGDAALLRYTRELDGWEVASAMDLEISRERIQRSLDDIPEKQLRALQLAADRIGAFHRHQLQDSWSYRDVEGNHLGQRIQPVSRAGLYVPGGKAAYPSSVLMNAIPAKVAGVREIIMVAPAPGGELPPIVLAAAAMAGVDRVFAVGGAQAVGALAYGTESVPGVDVIVGPGNQYVAEAKRQVFGQVGIDMIAGPSEVVIVSDGVGKPEWIAMDLFAQAEHDEQAAALLISPDGEFLHRVGDSMAKQLPGMRRRRVISAALAQNGALIQVSDIDEAMGLVNRIAPEHLQLFVSDPDSLLDRVHNAGAVFLGPYSPEALGDYCAGPNHVLPTSGSARFSSPLGVYHFQKRTSVIRIDPRGGKLLGQAAFELASAEGLQAHADSSRLRWGSDD